MSVRTLKRACSLKTVRSDDVFVMVVQAALTYAEAQMRIDDQSLTDEVTVGLRHLNTLAKILKQRRQQNGSVDGRNRCKR